MQRIGHRIRQAAVAALVAALALALSPATPAQAVPSTTDYHLLSLATGGQIAGASDGCNYFEPRILVPTLTEWRFHEKSNGYYEIKNVSGNTCHSCLDSNYAGQVYTIRCNGGTFQEWGLWHVGDKYQPRWQVTLPGIWLYNRQTQLALDANSEDVYTHAFNGGGYQTWLLQPFR